MANQETLSVQILDKEYRVSCPPGEHAQLLASADMLNRKLKDIRNKGNIIGAERIAIMAALNLSHDILNGKEAENRNNDITTRISALSKKIDATIRDLTSA